MIRPRLWFRCVFAAFILWSTGAAADGLDRPLCTDPAPQAAGAVHDQLPVGAGSSRASLARFALPYAYMAADAEDRSSDSLAAFGFVRGPNSAEVFAAEQPALLLAEGVAGFHATTFFHCTESVIVIVFGSVATLDLRDWLVSAVRQTATGEAPLALSFYDLVQARYPGHDIMVVGHSAAGGVASYVAAVRSVPSVLFNPARNDASFLNSGDEQLIVLITGDALADPLAEPTAVMAIPAAFAGDDRPLAGTELRIDPVGDYSFQFRLHQIDVVISELEALL